MAVGTKLFFDMMHDIPKKMLLYGPTCSHITAPLAEATPHFKVIQVIMALL